MARTKLFISHIQENASIAKALKTFIDEKFLGAVTVFVSSDGDILPGEDWQNRVISEIKESDIVLIVCTNASVHRPWVNFEAGGAVVRGAHVVPVCWHGCKPSFLPTPFSHFQALDLENDLDIQRLMELIADRAEMRLPEFTSQQIINLLPRRYTEQVDLAPSMFLGLDSLPPKGLRLEKEYGVQRRRTHIKPFRGFYVTIGGDGKADFDVEEEVIYFEHQDARTLKVYLSCNTEQEFRELRFHIDDADIVGWNRISETVVAVEVHYRERIRLLRPFRHKYSWQPPMIWGPNFDTISIPIEHPTGMQVLRVESKFPLAKAIAFKDLEITDDSDDEVAEKALNCTDYGCPPISLNPPGSLEWKMELPEIQSVLISDN